MYEQSSIEISDRFRTTKWYIVGRCIRCIWAWVSCMPEIIMQHWLLNVLAWPGQGIFMTSPDELHYELTTRGCYRMPSFFWRQSCQIGFRLNNFELHFSSVSANCCNLFKPYCAWHGLSFHMKWRCDHLQDCYEWRKGKFRVRVCNTQVFNRMQPFEANLGVEHLP